ncbi:MAG: transcription termination/antitermination NusG family protein [Streptococcus thermophilus]
MLDSFDKGWFVLQTYSGYENKVKENLLQRAQTYNMLEISCVLKSQLKLSMLRKTVVKEVEENRFPGYVLVEMVMTDEAWFVVRNTQTLLFRWFTETVLNQHHFWKKKSVKS